MKKKIMTLIISFCLCLAVIPITAFAEDSVTPVGTATITIINGVDAETGPNVIINKKYRFGENATLGDLFKAAKDSGDLGDYTFSYGYIASVTPVGGTEIVNAADWSNYWANYKNGDYAQGYTDCTEGDLLTDGICFQFSYESYPATFVITKDELMAISAQATEGTGEIGEKPSPKTDPANVNTSTDFDKSFNTLYKNLIAQSANDSGWKAMCAIAAGSPAGDIASAILSGLDSYANPNGTNIQKSIIVLTAMGVDVTELSDGQGGTVNLLDKMANTASAIGAWAESPAYALYAYAANPGYVVWGKATNTPENLITTLESYQTDDGGFGWGGMGSPDTTGAVLAALSCYTENAAANVMAAEALEALKAYQNADGGFGYSSGAETNIDSTAMAIVGLCAMGVDPTSTEWTKNGKNPMTALMSYAKEDLTGFTVPAGSDENYATEDAFRAMAAYAGLRNTGKAFNIYTQAASGQAVFEYKEPENNVPKTADSNNQWMWILLAFAGIATIGIIIDRKRHEN